jgi:hypothetical protein
MKKIGIIALCFVLLGTGVFLYKHSSNEAPVVSIEGNNLQEPVEGDNLAKIEPEGDSLDTDEEEDLSDTNENDEKKEEESVVDTGNSTVIQAAERYLAPELDWSAEYSSTPIYGLYSIILSRTRDFNDSIEEILSEIEYEREEARSLKPDEALMSLIETESLFAQIKSKTNTMYSLYSLDGKIGEYYGKYTQQLIEHFVDYIIFDEDAPDGFFISGTQNHMPQPVKVFVNCKLSAKERDLEIRKLREFDEEKLLEVGRQLIGEEREVIIAQYLECDLNNDQKVEKIVNYNNFISDPDVDEYLIGDQPKNSWQEKYYSILVILDDHYQPLGFIQNMPDFSGIDNLQAYEIGRTAVQYLVDIDNDNQMEIISFRRGWEYDDYLFSKFTADKVESYYQRYFWIFY